MKPILLPLIFALVSQFHLQSQNNTIFSHFTDKRDGKSYKAVRIGKQIWMAKNLSYYIKDASWPLDMSEENRKKSGLLYSWKGAQKACPTGWHLPSKDEWQQLIESVGKDKISDGALVDKTEGGTNTTGFSAVHVGCIDMEGFFIVAFASFWTGSDSEKGIWYVNLDQYQISLYNKDCKEWAGFSIRCVKNN